MFDMAKDERLTRISHRAGAIAFYCMWGATFLLMVAGQLVEADPFTDPAFNLVFPWLVGTFSYVTLLWTGGVYAALREESTSTPRKLLEARVRLAISTALFASVMFLIKRLDLLDHDSATITEDGISTLVVTAVWAAMMWFLMARRAKVNREQED